MSDSNPPTDAVDPRALRLLLGEALGYDLEHLRAAPDTPSMLERAARAQALALGLCALELGRLAEHFDPAPDDDLNDDELGLLVGIERNDDL